MFAQYKVSTNWPVCALGDSCVSFTGDALDENFALSDEDEGSGSGSDSDDDAAAAAANAQEARRQAAASGDHPLQKMFRQAAAKLAAKYGVEGVQQSDSSESDDEGVSVCFKSIFSSSSLLIAHRSHAYR